MRLAILILALVLATGLRAESSPKPSPAASAAEGSGVLKDDAAKFSYTIGRRFGQTFVKEKVPVDMEALIRGVKDGVGEAKSLISEEEAQQVLVSFQKKIRAEISDRNKKEGEAFLETNKKKDGVKSTASGLQYKVLKEGTGDSPKASDTVVTHYRGTLVSGKEFDSSEKHGGPATFGVGQVIPGWTEALQLMKVGSKWELYVPSKLAYGERQMGPDIMPNSTLIFSIELIEIKKN